MPSTFDTGGTVLRARPEGVALTGEHGLLTVLVTDILQRGLQVEMTAHVAGRFRAVGILSENPRNGALAKHLLTDLGIVELQMPRDRLGTFEPITVPKHIRRRAAPTAELARLYASGTTRAEMRDQLDQMTQYRLAPETADALADDLWRVVSIWERRRFESVRPVLLIDTVALNTADPRQVLDVSMAVDAYGDMELLSIWRRRARARGAERWRPMFVDLQARGVTDPECIISRGAPELATAAHGIWSAVQARSGVEGLVRNALR